jgi:hypothetical protein
LTESKQSENPASPAKKKIHGMSLGELNHLRPYFIGDDAGPQRHKYVLWVDIMGSQGKMLRGVRTASIPLMKLHVAALNAAKKNNGQLIELFPVIDGIYVVCEKLGPIEFFISDVFRSMAAEFLVLEHWERSVIRGAIAYGPVILGRESKKGAAILEESNYADSILLGMPLVQAYIAERTAPPFGVFVHESVRAFGPTSKRPVTAVLWRWWERSAESRKIASALLPSLDEYYEWSKVHTVSSSYPIDRIEAHRALTHEYLSEFRRPLNVDTANAETLEVETRQLRSTRRQKLSLDAVSSPRGPNARNKIAGKTPRSVDPESQAQRLGKKLGLSSEQIVMIMPILVERQQQLESVQMDESLNGSARTMKLRTIVGESEAKIEILLNEDQRKLFQATQHPR